MLNCVSDSMEERKYKAWTEKKVMQRVALSEAVWLPKRLRNGCAMDSSIQKLQGYVLVTEWYGICFLSQNECQALNEDKTHPQCLSNLTFMSIPLLKPPLYRASVSIANLRSSRPSMLLPLLKRRASSHAPVLQGLQKRAMCSSLTECG